MTAPGFLAVGGVELANNARTLAYLQAGLGTGRFEAVTGTACPDLLTEAWPLATCPISFGESFETSPMAFGRTRDILGNATYAGYTYNGIDGALDSAGLLASTGYAIGAVPALLSVPSFTWDTWVRVEIRSDWTNLDRMEFTRYAGSYLSNNPPGTAGYTGTQGSYEGIGFYLMWTSPGVFQLFAYMETAQVGTGKQSTAMFTTANFPVSVPGVIWLHLEWLGPSIVRATIYSNDRLGTPIAGPQTRDIMDVNFINGLKAIGISPGSFLQNPGYPFIGATQGNPTSRTPSVGLGRILDYEVLPVCTPTGELYPADGLWPAGNLYPNLYGEFHDPGTDNAPWVDADRPESYGYLGLFVDSIDGLDATSTRSMDSAADGIGGILGPESLDPRDVTVKGWLIADGCSSMEYARRWFADQLSGRLCSGCDSSYIDVRTTCGDDAAGDFYTNRWRIYDVGLTSIVTDVDGTLDCCYVTPISFKLAAADPYLYGPQVAAVASTLLNSDGADAVLVPFESWLFGAETPVCTTVTDQGIGVDAAIFTFSGGTTGIEGGVVYPGLGAYPSDSLWPNDCLYPADGSTQWTDTCPFAFTFAVGPGETFIVDNARRLLQWILSDGTVLDGAPKMKLNPGDVIQWIDTCAGASIDACAVAYASCTCDETAAVSVATQHRER